MPCVVRAVTHVLQWNLQNLNEGVNDGERLNQYRSEKVSSLAQATAHSYNGRPA